MRYEVQEKIGSGNFLWAFAAEATTKVQNDEANLTRAYNEAVVRHIHNSFCYAPVPMMYFPNHQSYSWLDIHA